MDLHDPTLPLLPRRILPHQPPTNNHIRRPHQRHNPRPPSNSLPANRTNLIPLPRTISQHCSHHTHEYRVSHNHRIITILLREVFSPLRLLPGFSSFLVDVGLKVGAALVALFAGGLRGGAAGVVARDGGNVRGVDVEEGGGGVGGAVDLGEGGGAAGGRWVC